MQSREPISSFIHATNIYCPPGTSGHNPGAGDSFTHLADIHCAPVVCQVLEMIKPASANKSSQCQSAAEYVLSCRLLSSLQLAASEQSAFSWKDKALPHSESCDDVRLSRSQFPKSL